MRKEGQAQILNNVLKVKSRVVFINTGFWTELE